MPYDHASSPSFYSEEACQLADLQALCAQSLSRADLSFAKDVQKNVPIYDAADLEPLLGDPNQRRALLSEWAWIFRASAGVLAIQGAVRDTSALETANAIFADIIAEEKAGSGGGGDHFAKAGANDRVWNSLQKLCLRAPEVFARCFASPTIAAACEAWLGPHYQVTAQVNLVRPGGAAQSAHRDYHLGFQTAAGAAAYPAHAHELTAALTLQGAVAHTDMPIESGPTKLLPFSQLYGAGYVAFRRPEFSAYFEESYVQLPLRQGDAVFFNPALFHAAGANTSKDVQRLAHLLQISSAFGVAMETIDRAAMSKALYPVLHSAQADASLTPPEIAAVVAASAQGYAFPTNLDTDPPVGGLAPQTQQDIMHCALAEGWPPEQLNAALKARAQRSRT
jgi:ectoine hydroxylase-related dioxygenase (phytanoyl-CoA dioxygenase family)